MKYFIKNKLRSLLEGRKATHTPSNEMGQDPKKASESNLIKLTHKLVHINNTYGQNEYLQNTHEGDGIYLAIIHTNGSVTIKTPNRIVNDYDIGLLRSGSYGNKQVFIKAYRGIEHKDMLDHRNGHAITTPAGDAAIKTYLIFGSDILEFVKQNMDGEDAYTSDNKSFKDKTNVENQYKYDKLEKEKLRLKNKLKSRT